MLDTGRSPINSCQRHSGNTKAVSCNQRGAKGPHGGGHTKGRGLFACSQPFQGSAVSAAADPMSFLAMPSSGNPFTDGTAIAFSWSQVTRLLVSLSSVLGTSYSQRTRSWAFSACLCWSVQHWNIPPWSMFIVLTKAHFTADLPRHSTVTYSTVFADGIRAAIPCKCSRDLDRTHQTGHLHNSRAVGLSKNSP